MSWMKRRSHVNPNTVPGSHVPLYNPNQHSNQENQWSMTQDVTSAPPNNWYPNQQQQQTQKPYGFNQQNSPQQPEQQQNYWQQQQQQHDHYSGPQQYQLQQPQYHQQSYNYYQNPIQQQQSLNDQYNQQYAQYPNNEVQNNPYNNVQSTQNIQNSQQTTDTWGNNWGWGDEDNSNVQQIPPPSDNSNQAAMISDSFNTEESWNWNVEDSTSTSKNDESSASVSQASLDLFPKMGKLSDKHQKNYEDNEKVNPNVTKIKKLDHLTPQWSTESQMSQESSDDILQTSESDKMLSRSSTISQSPISGQEVAGVDGLAQIGEEEYGSKPEIEGFGGENVEIISSENKAPSPGVLPSQSPIFDSLNEPQRNSPPPGIVLNKNKNITPPPSTKTNEAPPTKTTPPPSNFSIPAQSLSMSGGAFKRLGNVSVKSGGIPEGRRSPKYIRNKSPVYNQINLETVPDNSEQPDNVQVPLTRKVSSDGFKGSSQNQMPDNNEMISERNQYLETGKLSDENIKQEPVDTLPPPGLRRMVLGQMETNEARPTPNDEPPPGLSRMVLGQTESGPNMKLGFSRMIPGESSSPETSRQYPPPVSSYMDEPQDSEGEINQAPQQRSATIGADTPPGLQTNSNRAEIIIGQDSISQENDKERPESIEGQPTDPGTVTSITSGLRDLTIDSNTSIMDDPSIRRSTSDSEAEEELSRSSRDKQRDRRYTRESDRRQPEKQRYSPMESYDHNTKRGYRRRDQRHYDDDTDYYSDREQKEREDYEINRKSTSLRRSDKDLDKNKRRRDGYDRRGAERYERDMPRKKDNYDQKDYNRKNDRNKEGYETRKDYDMDRKDGRDYGKGKDYKRDRRDYETSRNKGDYYDRYGRYDDRYDDRSRPSSRSDSMREGFRDRDEERRYRDSRGSRRHNRDFNPYMQGFGYDPYNPYYQQYQMYYENMRRTNPQAYAEWYRKYYQQATGAAPSSAYGTEDRASVHSGRSSANEELKERYLRQTYYGHTALPHLGGYYRDAHSVSGQYGLDESSYSRPYDATDSSILDDTQAQRLTPAKFATAHTKASISSGKCIRILPHYPLDGQNAVVEFINMQKLLINDDEMEELVTFPGPLIKGVTPKKTVIEYCENKIRKASFDDGLIDVDSYVLLWELMILLIRQNGMVVGTDIAELLMKNKRIIDFRPPSAHSEPILGNDGSISDTGNSSITTEQIYNFSSSKTEEAITSKFREYLMYGSGKEALEWAMNHGLWGHALFLASKLDKRTYANVMMRFANGLTMNDPLQTLYQLLSGRLPASVTCVADEKWGDWRPHLAMILSNTTSHPDLDRKAITTMADTLMNRGSLYAAQFCYLMAEVGFSRHGTEGAKLVLLGSNHHKPHMQFATNEAIHLTEVYEYACSLNDPDFLILEFQVYKFTVATRLADRGLLEKALSYLERVAMAIIRHTTAIQPYLIDKVSDLADRLKHVDPMGDADDVAGSVTSWLKELKSVQQDYNSGLLYQDSNNSRLPSDYDLTHSVNAYEQEQSQPEVWQQQVQGDQFQQGSGQWSTDQSYDRRQEVQQDHQQQQEVITGYNQYHEQQSSQQQQFWVNQQQQPWNESSLSSLDQFQQHQIPEQQDTGVRPQENDYWSNQQAQNEPTDEVEKPKENDVRPQISMPNQQSKGKNIFDEGVEENQKDRVKETQNKAVKGPEIASKQASSGWFGGIFSKLALRPKNQMKLPDDKNPSIVWDPEKKKWVNLEEDQNDATNELKPPPKMSDLMPKMSVPTMSPPPGSDFSTHDPNFQSSYQNYQQSNQPDSLTMINNQSMSPNQPVLYDPSGPQITGNHSQSQTTFGGVHSANLPGGGVPGSGEEFKNNQPNMFKLQRGRNLKKSYVDVFNPGGKPSVPTMMQPPLGNSTAGGDTQMNYFIPTPVNDPNAPTDFLTPAPTHIEPQAQIPQQTIKN
ncbi:uncharacterized protein [Onthophagus taurus]|uniref:uncharacterized protein isoform X4 n=1 Tax=Onthophagus taurus TaxID=166361 RepID=UPI0039BDBE48